MRVDRALEKLRTALARRGVRSTSAALALVLAKQPALALPASLATSVTSVALASTAAQGGIALACATLMSTTKLGGWSVAIALLCVSLAGNAYWLTRVAPVTAPEMASIVRASAAGADRVQLTAALAPQTDLAGLRYQLRVGGMSEESIRALLEGILRRRYREELSAKRVVDAERGWWRRQLSNRVTGLVLSDDNPWLLQQRVTRPLEQLLGPDPLAVAEAEARYAFLPPELRAEFGRLDRELTTNQYSATGDYAEDEATRAQIAQERAVVLKAREALVATLTPEQRAAWEMRLSRFATNLSQQLENAAPTESEFLAVYPIAERLAQPAADGAAVDRRQQAADEFAAALGPDRAIDFFWGTIADYAAYARVARAAGLPSTTAGRIVQLAAETGRAAALMHSDNEMTTEQKKAALLALQQQVRPQLDALMPPEIQRQVGPSVHVWFDGLGDGSYRTLNPRLPSAMGVVSATSAPRRVDAPVPAVGAIPFVPRWPAAK